MQGKWRPPDWMPVGIALKDLKQGKTYTATKDYEKDIHLFTGHERDIFEAGADAMLEALKAHGSYGYHNASFIGMHKLGWLVFIPDEEVSNAKQS